MRALDVGLLHPRHESAELGAGLLDGMIRALLEQCVVFLVTALVFLDPLAGELAGLDVLERGFHPLFHAGVDDLWTNADIAPLGRLGDGEAHATDAGFVHQVTDQLQLVQALEVGHLGRVTRFGQHFEAGLHQRASAATKNRLLTEQIRLGFFLEVRLNDAGTGAADALGPGERDLLRVFARVLIHGDQARHPLAFEVLAANGVAGAFGRDHDHVHVLWRNDGLEVDRKAVAEQERLALGQVRLDVLLVAGGLLRVGKRNHDDVGELNGFGDRVNPKTFFLSDWNGFASCIEADDDVQAALLEIQCMGVTL